MDKYYEDFEIAYIPTSIKDAYKEYKNERGE